MSRSSPKTAAELRAMVESHLAEMTPRERRRFWLLITEHPENSHYAWVADRFSTFFAKSNGTTLGIVNVLAEEMNELAAKLKRHRRPKKNAERDAEIMALHRAGKTAGEIVMAMRGRFQLTDKSVNAVISRERRRPDPE